MRKTIESKSNLYIGKHKPRGMSYSHIHKEKRKKEAKKEKRNYYNY